MLSNSPEESPSASSTVVEAASPVSLPDARVPAVSHRGSGETLAGLRRVLGRASALRGPLFLRAGPTVAVICFLILFCFIISQICVDIQKYVFPSI